MRLREVLLATSLTILFMTEALSFRRWDFKKRALLFPRIAGLSAEDAELRGSMYESDPEFGRFLEGVRRCVPPDASVAVCLPSTTPRYFYTAVYALAPRPVIPAAKGSAADFLAVYRKKTATGTVSGQSVPGGTVTRLR